MTERKEGREGGREKYAADENDGGKCKNIYSIIVESSFQFGLVLFYAFGEGGSIFKQLQYVAD